MKIPTYLCMPFALVFIVCTPTQGDNIWKNGWNACSSNKQAMCAITIEDCNTDVSGASSGTTSTLLQQVVANWMVRWKLKITSTFPPKISLVEKRSCLDLTIGTCSNPSSNSQNVGGKIVSYNDDYGDNGWLGLATAWTNNGRIVKCVSKVNEHYFPSWNEDKFKKTLCQEIGHCFGLGHQSESSSVNDNTCMDYFTGSYTTVPDQHDFNTVKNLNCASRRRLKAPEEVDSQRTEEISTEARRLGSGSQATSGTFNRTFGGRRRNRNNDAAHENWGQKVRRGLYRRMEGDLEVFTQVIPADDREDFTPTGRKRRRPMEGACGAQGSARMISSGITSKSSLNSPLTFVQTTEGLLTVIASVVVGMLFIVMCLNLCRRHGSEHSYDFASDHEEAEIDSTIDKMASVSSALTEA